MFAKVKSERLLVVVMLLVFLMSCETQQPKVSPVPQPLPDFPKETYRSSADVKVYRIDINHSHANILVRRGGKLASFGHDHVVTARDIEGFVLFNESDLKNSHADLRLDLNTLTVDDSEFRQQFALDTDPKPQDIEKTERNMHDKVLQTDVWPQTHLSIVITGGSRDALEALLSIYLHGQTYAFPVTLNSEAAPAQHRKEEEQTRNNQQKNRKRNTPNKK